MEQDFLKFLLCEFKQKNYYYHISPRQLTNEGVDSWNKEVIKMRPRVPRHCLQKSVEQQLLFPEYWGPRICVSKSPLGCFMSLFGKTEFIDSKDSLFLYVTKSQEEAYRAINTNELDDEFYIFKETEFVFLYEIEHEFLEMVKYHLSLMCAALNYADSCVEFYINRHLLCEEVKLLIKYYDEQNCEYMSHPHFQRLKI